MLLDECPRDARGDFEVCHLCQRAAFFAGGFIKLLVRDVERTARYAASDRLADGKCPRCGSDRVCALGGKAGERGVHKCYACRKPFTLRTATPRQSAKLGDDVWDRARVLFADGASTVKAAEVLGITQKTAWRLKKRLGEEQPAQQAA